jgi:hypothetical protein
MGDLKSLSGRQQTMICCVSVGAAGALLVKHLPQYASAIQIALFTFMVFGCLFLGLWPDRHRRLWGTAILFALALHGIVLYLIRSMFPFRSILIIIPIALAEAVAMFTLILKILGDRDAEQRK